ncbi:hypothetical protein [Sphingobacterium hungaricum]|uniref:DUF3945 domain-containing protein n=1 Tax=Sphingobacterium hungaricum TaxID=2082723 RepID=A0A928YRN6_9SPHI|nr:hypothetical protein [Sphingobacterium hungaricum]MBE8714852.1 hypothetical protein [Sphingobacterium hungaricum]
MNENNLEYLKKTLDGLGFGSKLNDVLENAIRREMPAFSLGISSERRPLDTKDINATRTDHLAFTINFNRSKESDMYFLNNYDVTLRKANNPVAVSQTFDLARDHRITALQAHKLLSGLALEKEVPLRPRDENQQQGKQPEKMSVWFKLNLDVTDAYGNHPLRTFRPEYGYDVASALGKYPIKGLDTPEKMQQAINTLKNGNYLHADLLIGKKNLPVSIVANPQMKTIDIFDKNRTEVRDETIFPERTAKEKADASQAVATSTNLKAGQQKEPLPWEQAPEQQQAPKRSR